MQRRAFRATSLLIAAVGLLAAGVPASAYTVTQLGPAAGGNPGDLCPVLGGATCQPYYEISGLVAGDSFVVAWVLDGNEILGADLVPDFPVIAAEATLTVTSVSSTTVVLDVTLDNTTDPLANDPALIAPIISFGAEIEGFGAGSLTIPGTSLDTYDSKNLAGGEGLTTDFCASTNPGCNKGQAAQGIQIGGSDSFQFELTGTFDAIGGITLRNIATKWQTNYDTITTPDDPYVVAGNSSFEQPGLPAGFEAVPEPGTGLLLCAALFAWAISARRP